MSLLFVLGTVPLHSGARLVWGRHKCSPSLLIQSALRVTPFWPPCPCSLFWVLCHFTGVLDWFEVDISACPAYLFLVICVLLHFDLHVSALLLRLVLEWHCITAYCNVHKWFPSHSLLPFVAAPWAQVVVRCSVLKCVAVCWQCIAKCCSVLQCVAVCCSVLQCVAVCCNVLQCAAMCCSVLQCVTVRCSVLRYVAVCYGVLQCVAVCITCALEVLAQTSRLLLQTVFVCVCVRVCASEDVCVCVREKERESVGMWTCVRMWVYACVCLCMSVCACACEHVCVCVCVCTCTLAHMYLRGRQSD